MKGWYQRVYRYNQYNRDRWVASQAAVIPSGARILDVGAGAAPYRSLFAHCDYHAHDFGQEPGTAGKHTELDYESDITNIPVASESFDVILCTEVLEHVPEPIEAVREFGRILRKDGRLLLTGPLCSFLHQEPYHFYGGYTPHWYRRFLPEAGFEIEDIETNMGFFSLFGQEAGRFSSYLDPRRTLKQGIGVWLGLTLVWLVTVPFARGLFPLLGGPLDRLGLEQMSTAWYHVTAIRVKA